MQRTLGIGGLAGGPDDAAEQALEIVLPRSLLQHLDHRRCLFCATESINVHPCLVTA